jgi:hypothetical protein
MTDQESRSHLKQRVIDAFAQGDEVFRIVVFGREIDGLADRFSDLDLIVCSSDLAATQAAYRARLATIAPIRETFLIESTPDHLAEMIMFHDHSPYHKIDLSILDNLDHKAEFGPFLTVYEQSGRPPGSVTRLAAAPPRHDIARALTDVLFSLPRFLKAAYRRNFDLYRYWKTTTDLTLSLLYEKYAGWRAEPLSPRLRSFEAKWLYGALDSTDRARLARILPPDGQLDVPASFQASVALFCATAQPKADQTGIALNQEFVTFMQQFLAGEIARLKEDSS